MNEISESKVYLIIKTVCLELQIEGHNRSLDLLSGLCTSFIKLE